MFKKLFTILALIAISGCSVYKAASNEGVAISDIAKCRMEGCFLSYGMDIVDRHQEEDGTYQVTYRAIARKSGGSYVRAAGHGVMDVATLGLWEVVGTPVEGALSNNRGYITVKALYPRKGNDFVTSFKVYDVYGKLVLAKIVQQ